MKYKTELHCHSKDASGCSHETAEGIAEKYYKAGYTTIFLTNHFAPSDGDAESWEAKVEKRYHALELLEKASAGRMNILMGLEFRFTQNSNDYLVFGFDKEYLLNHRDMLTMGVKNFTKMAREDGLLTIQAHPFRFGMVVTNPDYVDGIEVFNGHPGHNSNNDIAEVWAEKYGKIKTSGTDHHDPEHQPRGGILTDFPITSEKQLIEVLRSGNYELIKG